MCTVYLLDSAVFLESMYRIMPVIFSKATTYHCPSDENIKIRWALFKFIYDPYSHNFFLWNSDPC